MKAGVGLYLVGAGVLVALAGCGRNAFMMGEREPWRHEAEVSCMKSGVVKLGVGVVRMEPIEGPGMCGADFPLKVAALGESNQAIGYADDPRPPGAIPNASAQMPNWPVSEPRAPPARVAPVQVEPMPGPSGAAPRMIGPRYDGALPPCEAALGTIASRFATKEGRFWNSDLQILGFDKVRETAFRPWAAETVPRRYCSAVAMIAGLHG